MKRKRRSNAQVARLLARVVWLVDGGMTPMNAARKVGLNPETYYARKRAGTLPAAVAVKRRGRPPGRKTNGAPPLLEPGAGLAAALESIVRDVVRGELRSLLEGGR